MSCKKTFILAAALAFSWSTRATALQIQPTTPQTPPPPGQTLPAYPGSGMAPGVILLGAGASPCAKYLADIRSAPAFQAVYSNWALGYLTALNIINSGKPGARAFSDTNGLDYRLQTYCSANPAKTYSDAVTDLALQFAR